jgi:hypothetical protein
MRKILGESRGDRRIRRAPAGKWLPWVFSAVLALILWVTAIQDRFFTVSMVLPVSPPDIPSGYMITSDISAESVTVEFAGNGVQVILDQVFRRPAALDLGDFDPGSTDEFPRAVRYQFSGGNVSYPGPVPVALEAQSFVPQSITLLVDRKMVRSMPVSVPASGGIPARFMWPSLSRTSVDVTGAATVVTGLDSIATEPVLPGEGQARVSVLLPRGVSGANPRTVSASYTAPVPVVSEALE